MRINNINHFPRALFDRKKFAGASLFALAYTCTSTPGRCTRSSWHNTHTHTPREIINIYFELCCRCVSMFAIFAEVISESALAKLTVSCAAQRERRISHTHSAINQFRNIKRWSERMKRIKEYPMSIIILCSVRDDKFNGFDKYFEYFFSFRLSCASLPDSATGSNSSSNSVGRQMNDDAIRKANHGNATHQQKSFIHLIM